MQPRFPTSPNTLSEDLSLSGDRTQYLRRPRADISFLVRFAL
jgi:hypothetical protein